MAHLLLITVTTIDNDILQPLLSRTTATVA